VNPARFDDQRGRSKTIPPLIEEGGGAVSNIKILEGYYARKVYFKNGNVNVNYKPIYSKWYKHFRMHPRPFLKPALKKAAEKLLEILENSIGK